jgi:hypothetical protein
MIIPGLESLLEDMKLPTAWKAIKTYWLPERALTGKQPVPSVYSLLRGCTLMKT